MEHRPRKRFGQNFLHDPIIIRNILAAIAARPGQRLVEIGPGQGAITRQLLEQCGELDVVELDRDLIPILNANCAGLGELRIHNVDALRFDFTTLVDAEHKLRVVGNLPYNISTPLIFHLLDSARVIEDMHFMLQKEVVDRLAAGPGSKAYGRLGIMVQYHCRVEHLFNVPPGAFNPPPKVDSAVVRLVPHAAPPFEVTEQKDLARVVTQAFSQRRKTLRNTLKKLLDSTAIESLGIDPARRPETITLEEYAKLANAVTAAEQGLKS